MFSGLINFFACPYFENDAPMPHALHVLDAPGDGDHRTARVHEA